MRFMPFFIIFAFSACVPVKNQPLETSVGFPGLGVENGTQMTEHECVQAGGTVIGDIGDGRIHQHDYLCENGEVPLGSIVPALDKPNNSVSIPVDGAVCCDR